MTLKTCPCCKKVQTTKNAQFVGRRPLAKVEMLYFNCKTCRSTFVLVKGYKVKTLEAA